MLATCLDPDPRPWALLYNRYRGRGLGDAGPSQGAGHTFRADKESRVATNTLYFSRQHPSRIVLPIFQETKRAEK
jgi:hypothetical protein